jgi:methylated-DNA-[protein]-cysteine S-methyltransferase
MALDAHEVLRRFGLRVTPQRRAIVEAFHGGDAEHLAADEVHSRACVAVPEVGRGTVYATLAELTELGLLASVGNPDPVRYEINLVAHDHFHCRLCLRLFDVELSGRRLASRSLEGFVIEHVSVIAEGTCAECRDYGRGLTTGAADIMTAPLLSTGDLSGLACARVESPVGELAVAASDAGIVRVAFPDHADFDELIAHARARRGPGAARVRLGELSHAIQGYFDGDRGGFVDVVDWRLSSKAMARALTAVGRIPYAGSQSYDRLMGDLSPLECGRAMGANPIPVLCPCHRVTRGSDRPETYVGGADRLRALRTLEDASAAI